MGRFAASTTKPDVVAGGPALVRAMSATFPEWPQLAIGGIGPDNIDQVVAAGGVAIAVCEAACDADDPAAVVADLRNRLQQASESAADAGMTT